MLRFRASLALLLATAGSLAAQNPAVSAPAIVPQGAFVGTFKSTLDKFPVRLVDIRLYRVDSTKTVSAPMGTTVDVFVDTARSRLAATDSTGFFALWHVPTGRYLMQARRIGFTPIEAYVAIDSEPVLHDFIMEPIAAMLNRVEVREASMTRVGKRLDRVGFTSRRKFHECDICLMPGDLERFRPQTIRDILVKYGIFNRDVDIIMDNMVLDYYDVDNYPADLVAGVEIYRHGRPLAFSGTRYAPTLLAPGGGAVLRRSLVVIWTYIP